MLTMERAVQIMVEQADLPLLAVLPLATEVTVERVFVRGREISNSS